MVVVQGGVETQLYCESPMLREPFPGAFYDIPLKSALPEKG